MDSKGSSRDPCLLGPPTVEFAPYGRIPGGRPRKDARQGTIDQDPEFMSFLEGLTNPVAKMTAPSNDDESMRSKEKVTTTPLVRFLKEKKANKGKELAAAKLAKQNRQDKENKATENKSGGPTNVPPQKRSAQAVKVEKAARDAVKALNKQANVKGAPVSSSPSKPQNVTPVASQNSAANSALGNKQRERGNVKSAAQILQRDLGLGGSPRGRGGRHVASKNAGPTEHTSGKAPPNANIAKQPRDAPAATPAGLPKASTAPATQQTANNPSPSGPKAKRTDSSQSSETSSQPTPSKSTTQQPASTATQAFLKHANPSQGVTEPLLEDAFKVFGTVVKVEIDKKKGFAYIDFAEPETLQQAIRASPIKVAQGSVQVLERKTGQQLQAKNNVRGGGAMNSNPHVSRGGPPLHNNPRGGPVGGHSSYRGGHPSNRGNGPMGGRGGHMRGRGGIGRGGNQVPPVKSGSSGAVPSSAQVSTAPQAPTPVASTGETSGG